MRFFRELFRRLFGPCEGPRHRGPIATFQFAELELERRVIAARILLARVCLDCGEQVSGFRALTLDPVDMTDAGFDELVEPLKAGEKRIIRLGLHEGN